MALEYLKNIPKCYNGKVDVSMLACSLVTRTCLKTTRFDFLHVQMPDIGGTKP